MHELKGLGSTKRMNNSDLWEGVQVDKYVSCLIKYVHTIIGNNIIMPISYILVCFEYRLPASFLDENIIFWMKASSITSPPVVLAGIHQAS